jgi:beta-galactosidase
MFGGNDGVHDLEGFLQTAQEASLYVIARPGPYQYSELQYDGLPKWLCENYPELRAQAIDGQPLRTASISYVHPLFLEKVRKWFSNVCPIISKYTVSRGGPIAFVQINNEMTGVHVWNNSLDYNPVSMGFGKSDGRFPHFLRERYDTIGALNRHYETSYGSFEAVRPIAPVVTSKTAEIRRMKDYFDFYLSTIAEYAQALSVMIREHGIDTPLVHNSAGPTMNAYFVETAKALGDSFILGSDHYYSLDQNWPQNNPTPQYALSVFCSLETLRLMGFPPTVFELPSGSLSDWPPITAEDSKACYWLNLAYGMKGSNYYIFTGGPNAPGTGNTADIYDYGAPIAANGEIRPLYYVQREFGRWLKNQPWLMEAEREFDCHIGFDFTAARAENYWKSRGGFLLSSPEAWDFCRKGVLTTALCSSLSPVLCDLRSDDWVTDTSTPVIVVSSASLSAGKQARIVRFLKQGGSILLLPVLPSVDEDLKPCTILSDFLGSPTIATSKNEFSRVTIDGVANIYNNGEIFPTTQLPPKAEVLGVDEISKAPLAWKLLTEGGGTMIFLGFRWLHAKHEHEQMLRTLLKRLRLKQKIICSNPNVWTSLRTKGSRSVLFVMNLLSSPQEAEISYQPSFKNGMISAVKYRLDPMTVKMVEIL